MDRSQIKSDVLLIGAGVIGLSLARALHKKGVRRIIILERGAVGRESSLAAAGMLAPHAETGQKDDFYRFCSESLKLYQQFAAELFDETGIDIELDRRGTLYLALDEKDSELLRRRFEWQKKAEMPVERLSAAETRRIEPFVSPDVRESLFFPEDWQVENKKLLRALEKYCRQNEIDIREGAEVRELLSENGAIVGAETAEAKYFAEKTVLTTGAWTSLIKTGELILPKVEPVRGQMISFQTAKRLFEKVIYSPRGYLVPRRDGRILIGATVEKTGFDKSVTEAGTEFLRETAIEIAPSLVNLKIADRWAGLRPFAPDGLPVLGEFRAAKNLLVATAHYRNGILLAPLTARILADKTAEDLDSEYLKIYSPERFSANCAQHTARHCV